MEVSITLTLEIGSSISFVDGSGSDHSFRCMGCGSDPKRYYKFQGRFKEIYKAFHLMGVCNGCFQNSEAFSGFKVTEDGSSDSD